MIKLYLDFEHAVSYLSTLSTNYIRMMKHNRDTGDWQA